MKQIIIAVGFGFFCNGIFADCLKADRLEFRQIDENDFLVSRDGKNIAILRVRPQENIRRNNNTWEFFTPKICDGGANGVFMLNGKKSFITSIQIFIE